MADSKTAYGLWFFIGWTGLHHLYLGRVIHAFIWFVTLGGGCGLGWIRDFWRIPEYIKWCDPDKQTRKQFLTRVATKVPPECSAYRELGMAVFGYAISTVLVALVPNVKNQSGSDPVTYYSLIIAKETVRFLGNALGVCLVANIGELKCSLYCPLLSSMFAVPCCSYATGYVFLGSLVTARITKMKGIQWRPPRQESAKRGKLKTFLQVCVYVLACTAWVAIVIAGFYLYEPIKAEARKTTKDGEGKFTSSHELYDVLSITAHELFGHMKTMFGMGLKHVLKEAWSHVDFTEKIQAYSNLGVFPGTSQEKVSKVCRDKLAEHHPDRFREPLLKEKMENVFLQIHKACGILNPSRQQKTRGGDVEGGKVKGGKLKDWKVRF